MRKYTLHSVGLSSLFKFGLVLGLLSGLLPAILAIKLVVDIARGLAPILLMFGQFQGQNDPAILRLLQNFTTATVLDAILLVLVLVIITALYNGLIFLLSGLVFNLLSNVMGGLQFTLSDGGAAGAPAALPVAAPAPSPAAASAAAPVGWQAGPRLEVNQPYPQVLPVRVPETVVGSAASCQVRLDGLPPFHFKIIQQAEHIILVDMTNGQAPVFVQGHKVQAQNLLKDGFSIQASQYQMVFRNH